MAKPLSITPFLWFNTQAEEAVNFYVSLFANSKITSISRYPEAGNEQHGGEPGKVMVVEFELSGRPFCAMNGGPHFKLDEAFSLQIDCETQEEIDRYWNALTSDGGQASDCGWCKDKFGLSWQVTPRRLMEMIASDDKAAVGRAMGAMMTMQKLDLPTLERAYEGVGPS